MAESINPTVVATVIIGQNEGERLRRALRALDGGGAVIYVDSASTDESVDIAERHGAVVVELDDTAPFSAARGRNAGFEHLRQSGEVPDFVQFVDGDCEVLDAWWGAARQTLEQNPDVALVAGRLRERNREGSVFNRLCDMEWDRPIGDVDWCGGIFMARASAFSAVGGFDPNVLAGEEPELCMRLRQAGWRIRRIDQDMALHDAAMHSFGQWWRRNVRNGHAFAEGADRHGRSRERHWVRESLSNWFWGLCWPLFVILLIWPTYGLSVIGLLAYPAMVLRIAWRTRKARHVWSEALLYGFFTMLGKFPNALGQCKYWLRRLREAGIRRIGCRGMHGGAGKSLLRSTVSPHGSS